MEDSAMAVVAWLASWPVIVLVRVLARCSDDDALLPLTRTRALRIMVVVAATLMTSIGIHLILYYLTAVLEQVRYIAQGSPVRVLYGMLLMHPVVGLVSLPYIAGGVASAAGALAWSHPNARAWRVGGWLLATAPILALMLMDGPKATASYLSSLPTVTVVVMALAYAVPVLAFFPPLERFGTDT